MWWLEWVQESCSVFTSQPYYSKCSRGVVSGVFTFPHNPSLYVWIYGWFWSALKEDLWHFYATDTYFSVPPLMLVIVMAAHCRCCCRCPPAVLTHPACAEFRLERQQQYLSAPWRSIFAHPGFLFGLPWNPSLVSAYFPHNFCCLISGRKDYEINEPILAPTDFITMGGIRKGNYSPTLLFLFFLTTEQIWAWLHHDYKVILIWSGAGGWGAEQAWALG